MLEMFSFCLLFRNTYAYVHVCVANQNVSHLTWVYEYPYDFHHYTHA